MTLEKTNGKSKEIGIWIFDKVQIAIQFITNFLNIFKKQLKIIKFGIIYENYLYGS